MQAPSEQSAPTVEFVAQIKEILTHLYDYPFLQQHPLAKQVTSSSEHRHESASAQLRRELINALESLNPGPEVSFRAPHARAYNIVHLHYVEGLTVQEAAHELGISVRQAHRDLRQGEENMATILWPRLAKDTSDTSTGDGQLASRAVHLSSPDEEIARLDTHQQPVDFYELITQAQMAVEKLAAQHGVELRVSRSTDATTVATVPEMAQQLLVSLLSHIIQQTRLDELLLAVQEEPQGLSMHVRFVPRENPPYPSVLSDMALQLAGRLGWSLQLEDTQEQACEVALSVVGQDSTVLVIDDNAGLVELLRRYLGDHAYRVIAATGGDDGFRLAQEFAPDAIVLDVMMPQVNGWQVLQMIRNHPCTQTTPVIICSVFNDPGLAYSLGASLCLSKPVRRDEVLEALHKLDVK